MAVLTENITLQPVQGTISQYRTAATYGLLTFGCLIFFTGLLQKAAAVKISLCFFSFAFKGLAFAFAYNIRDRSAYEIISFDEGDLRIDYYNPKSKKVETYNLDSYFARAEVVLDTSDTWNAKKRLKLSSRKEALYIGDFLPPDTLEKVADKITRAIQAYNAPLAGKNL